MSQIETLVDRYFEVWNEPDPERRLAIASEVWVPGGAYVDPLGEADGPAQFTEMVANLQATHPGMTLRRTSPVEQHHDRIRFNWEVRTADGDVYIDGVDFAEVDEHGRLVEVTGFFGSAIPTAVG